MTAKCVLRITKAFCSLVIWIFRIAIAFCNPTIWIFSFADAFYMCVI